MAMGNVVEFRLKSGKTIVSSRHAADIASLSLELTGHLQTIEICSSAFEKDMRTIQAIAAATRDPELRQRLLRELECLQGQLSLAFLAASKAKRSMRVSRSEAVLQDE